MTHPGEQFYPEGVHWDDAIARGTLPDLLSKAAAQFGGAAGDRIPRPRRSATPSWKRWSRPRPRRSCAPAMARTPSVALFLGNSPDHPVNFFGALKAGARRRASQSPLDGEIALSHKLTRLRRARARHQQPRGAAADGAEIPRQGPARSPDRLRGRSLGQGRQSAGADSGSPRDRHLQRRSSMARPSRRNGRRSRPMTSRCCNIPAAPPACRRARCSATAI